MANGRYVEPAWRMGPEVGGNLALARGQVVAAIGRLMTDEDGAKTRVRAAELKKAAGECTGEGGSSRPAIDKLVTHMLAL
jgi:hypothetical protein